MEARPMTRRFAALKNVLTEKQVKRLIRRWARYNTAEHNIYKATTNPDSKARSYGAWLANRQCILELARMFKEGK